MDNYGWNFISQPKVGHRGDRDFSMRFDQMRENITFEKLDVGRNVGVSGEVDYWDGMKYEVNITTISGDPIHQEMGHFLLRVGDDGKTEEELEGEIIRQATIPRANSFMTHGVLEPGSVGSAIEEQNRPFYTAHPKLRRPGRRPRRRHLNRAFQNAKAQVLELDGPDFARPLEFLANTLSDEVIDSDWVFGFRDEEDGTQMSSVQRVEHPVGIGKLFSDFWIGRRVVDGEEMDVLQYAQVVDLRFDDTLWPHVAINTLVRQ